MCKLILTTFTEPADAYLKSFHWNKVKYRADKPIGEIVDTLHKVPPPLPAARDPANRMDRQEISSIDNDVKGKYNQYNQVKTQLTVLQRKQTYVKSRAVPSARH